MYQKSLQRSNPPCLFCARYRLILYKNNIISLVTGEVTNVFVHYVRSFIVLVSLTVCKYRYYAFEIRATSGFASSSSGSLESMLTIGSRMPRSTVNDIVSKNITMVLENLLMNYENSQLPTHGKGKKRRCEVLFLLYNCNLISFQESLIRNSLKIFQIDQW